MKLPRPPFALALVAALALAGCATGPANPANARPVPSRRVLPGYAQFSHPLPHGSRVIVIRDAGRLDVPVKAEVLVDGLAVAEMAPGERLELCVYAGDRILGVSSSPGFFAAPILNHSFLFAPGRTYRFRVGVVDHYLDIHPAAVAAADAEPE